MRRVTIAAVLATSLAIGGSAVAQTTAPSTPPVAVPAPTAGASARLTLTEAQAREWVDKRVYSNEGRDIGEVVAFTRDSSGVVTEMHADIGGFLGIGESRVRVMPAQFTLAGDRVTLNMTADQAKALPKISN